MNESVNRIISEITSEEKKRRFSAIKFLETRTGRGQLIQVWHPVDVSSEEVKRAIQDKVAEIVIPSTGRVIAKGGYCGSAQICRRRLWSLWWIYGGLRN